MRRGVRVFDCGVNEDEHVAVVRPRGVGIHVLLVYAHLCRERARRFLLAGPRAHVRQVMEIVDTHRRLAVAASVEGAVEEIAARAAEGV